MVAHMVAYRCTTWIFDAAVLYRLTTLTAELDIQMEQSLICNLSIQP